MRIIGGNLRNRPLKAPKGLDVRPTAGSMRKAIFDICQHCAEEGSVLDIFAGSGALGLEAISRGFTQVTFIDNSRPSIQCIKQNAKTLGVEKQATVLQGDAFRILEKLQRRYDLILADPPYHKTSSDKLLAEKLLELVDTLDLLNDDGFFFLECDSKTPLDSVILTHLKLKSSRRIGRSMLYQYEKSS